MSDLVTSENVAILRKAFEDHEGFELSLPEFMNTMNRVVLRQRAIDVGRKVTQSEQIAFAVDMVELFKQIDVNGNGKLEWAEFTAYIVETGRMLESKETQELRKTTEAGFFVGERESRYAEHQEDVTNVERGHRDENEIINDGGLICIGEPFNCLAVICKSSDVIRLFGLPMRPKQVGFKSYKPQSLRHHTQFRPHRALGITYIPNLSVGVEGNFRNYIVSSSIDEIHGTGCFISFWERVKRSLKIVCRVSMNNVMDQLCWCAANDTLYTASSTHTATIEAWKLSFELGTTTNGEAIFHLQCHKVAILQWHSSPVTRLRYIPDNVSPQIASFSKDGTVSFWNTHTNRKSSNQNMHDRGVRGCAVSMKLAIMVTVGFGNICFPETLSAIVWRIQESNSIEDIAKLIGHEHPLVDVAIHEFPDDLAHIVTIDERGHLRRWCAHRYICLQSFDVPETVYGGQSQLLTGRPVELQALAPLMLEWRVKTHEPPHPGIVVASGTSLGVIESLPVHHAAKPLIASLFNSVSMTFLTCAARSMRIWDALTGSVLRTYGSDLLFPPGDRTTEITCCCLDDRKRKIITGDNRGKISVWNYLNGALMKILDPHAKDVSSLIYINNEKLTVSTSWDGRIFVNDELDNDGFNKAARKSVLMRDIQVISTVGGQKSLFNPRSATPSGKHLRVDVAGLTESQNCGMLATCSHIGTTLVLNCWDFEYMRLLGSIYCPSRVTESGEKKNEGKINDPSVTIPTVPTTPAPSPISKKVNAQKTQQKNQAAGHNEIMSIKFLDPFTGLVFSDDSGGIYLCVLPVLRRKFKCVGALLRPSRFEGDKAPTTSVLSLISEEDKKTGGLIIFAGCENGEVVEWYLSKDYLKQELGITKTPKGGYKQPAFNGRRSLRNGKYRAKELLPTRSQRGGVEVDMLNIKPKRWWRAHNLGKDIPGRDAVIDIHLIEQPHCLLCVSQNGTANLWDLEMNVDEEKMLLENEVEENLTIEERIARNKRELQLAEKKQNSVIFEEGGGGVESVPIKIDYKNIGNLPKPRMLGILDPDINRATPQWKFTLNIEERKRNNIVEAKRILKEARELLKKPKRKSWEEDDVNSESGRISPSSHQSQDSAKISPRSQMSSLFGSPRSSNAESMFMGPPSSPIRVPNKHDYDGHDNVMTALDAAFVRSPSPSRSANNEAGIEIREDFSSSNSAVTADMLRGRVSGDGGEMMKWRREAEENKKHHRFPRIRDRTKRSSKSKNRSYSAASPGLRSRVLNQLAPKKYGYIPQGSPTKPPTKWYEYSGSRSTVPKLRHLDPDKLSGYRNDGWNVSIAEAMSDNLSVIADDEDDLEIFLNKKIDPADAWIDRELSSYAADLHAKTRGERLNPNNKITGAPKGAGVTETIKYMKRESRHKSNSNVGRKMMIETR